MSSEFYTRERFQGALKSKGKITNMLRSNSLSSSSVRPDDRFNVYMKHWDNNQGQLSLHRTALSFDQPAAW